MCEQGNEGCNNSNYNEIKINCGPVHDYIQNQGRAEDFFLPGVVTFFAHQVWENFLISPPILAFYLGR